MRPSILRALALAAALTAFSAAALAQTAPARITLIHFNDTDQMSPRDGSGGVAEAMTIIRRLRAENPNTILTFGGDMFSPSLMASFDHGAHMVALTSAMGVEVAVPGNHEFDFGPDEAKARIGEAKYPWLGANVIENGQTMGGLKPSFIREMAGYKLGFFGVVTERSRETTSAGENITFANAQDAARREARALRAQGADVVVGLCHLAYGAELALLRAVPEVDICLSGDDHIAFVFYDGRQLALEAGANLQFLGVLDLHLSKRRSGDRDVVTWRPEPRLVSTAGSPADPELAALVSAYSARLDSSLNTQIGTVAAALDSRHSIVRRQEAAFGNLLADAMRAATGADIALTNGGGFRADKQYPVGHAITRRDILSELPFGNIAVVLRVTGAQLRTALENGVGYIEEGAGRFPQVSGIAFDYDAKAKRGERVGLVTVGGKPLDLAGSYTLATNDFLARGGDGYVVFRDAPKLVDERAGRLLATVLMDHIAAQKTVTARINGRVTAR